MRLGDPEEAKTLEAARAGNEEAFAQLTDPYRRELLAHCYRILGSYEDAEDMLQETLLRAWKHLNTFEGRASLRAWLYKISTNVCLDALVSRGRRRLPRELSAPANPADPLPLPSIELSWVDPFPDELVEEQPDFYPEARYEVRESITLAFVAALQNLPGRQRAALLLCDVLGWSPSETAEILEASTTAVNSALQRARTTMKQSQEGNRPAPVRMDEALSGLLKRYVAAWEAADAAAIVAVLREDVALTMPPFPVWFHGRAAVRRFLEDYLFKSMDPFKVRLQAVRANSSPAFAVYQMDPDGVYRAAALHVLEIEDGLISEINDFLTFDGGLFSRFHLPPVTTNP